jgi:hypothetical protein
MSIMKNNFQTYGMNAILLDKFRLYHDHETVDTGRS